MAEKQALFTLPPEAKRIEVLADLSLKVPDNPVILYIEGDGIGPDIWKAARPVFEAAVDEAFGGQRKVYWVEVLAGEKAHELTGKWLPEETLEAFRKYLVGIKGPLTTPVAGGYRSLNVALRQGLDLYACVRPVRYFPGVPSPVKHPERLDLVIFRENTEDVYAGIEWPEGSEAGKKVIDFLKQHMGIRLRPDSGIGIKPISRSATQRLVRRAIYYALDNQRPSVTLVHKGNIMKYTEGAFRDWGYELARDEFANGVITEQELAQKFAGNCPPGKVVIKDRLADAMFQQVLLRPKEYSVIALPNLNGDYLSDACAAQVGGLGLAPGANIGDRVAIFEATHGTAPKYAGQDRVNPGSLILSGAMMFRHLGWQEAGTLIEKALAETIRAGTVTYDLHRQMRGARLVKCSQFGAAIVERIGGRVA